MEEFLREFGRFLCEDSRHDLWVRSHDDDATIVLDRHNVIYAYGPLDAFEAALKSRVRVEASQRCLVLTCIITMLRGMKRSDGSCGLSSGTSSRFVRPTCNSTRRATIDSSMQLALERAPDRPFAKSWPISTRAVGVLPTNRAEGEAASRRRRGREWRTST